MRGRNVDDVVAEWAAELQQRSRSFSRAADALASWDSAVLAARGALLEQEARVARAARAQAALEGAGVGGGPQRVVGGLDARLRPAGRLHEDVDRVGQRVALDCGLTGGQQAAGGRGLQGDVRGRGPQEGEGGRLQRAAGGRPADQGGQEVAARAVRERGGRARAYEAVGGLGCENRGFHNSQVRRRR